MANPNTHAHAHPHSSPSHSILQAVRVSSHHFLTSAPSLVQFNLEAFQEELSKHPQLYSKQQIPPNWHQWYHFYSPSNPLLSVQYILLLDSLNFCFWPSCEHGGEYEYSHLASALKRVILHQPDAFTAENLQNITAAQLECWLQPIPEAMENLFRQRANRAEEEGKILDDSEWTEEERKFISSQWDPHYTLKPSHIPIPLIESRTLAVREVGYYLLKNYSGNPLKMIESAEKSANRLVEIILGNFFYYRDSSVYQGELYHFYKRAQILIGDLWGAFKGKSYGEFRDIEEITCFADYRIPQLLRQLNILSYHPELAKKIDEKEILPAGSLEEFSIRAATIQAIEKMKEVLKSRGISLLSIELDWILWERGEASMDKLKPHHRTKTVFY